MTVSSWLNFGSTAPLGRESAAGRKFLAPPYYSQRAVFASLWALFSSSLLLLSWNECYWSIISSKKLLGYFTLSEKTVRSDENVVTLGRSRQEPAKRNVYCVNLEGDRDERVSEWQRMEGRFSYSELCRCAGAISSFPNPTLRINYALSKRLVSHRR